ncbi:hypothetical protein GCM10010358_22980 [Streptomyces minutiscleroticus]|uniref:Uncharacterized protein n=1 Tax=Streptomyces minutiscleroticus TaxID=68238 RepID=A0A918KL11_9ACTN|nr:hypothetical protein [Streptomyces minutiscleroticus]GGX67944.1 hypothetical protein GCM10010358_22980 [Streptomyces minutiscleroticus]
MAGKSSEESISDEEWERFLRDSERGVPADAPKEPSARARMVTERLRQQDARGELPTGWRTGPAWRETDGRAARRRKWWAVAGVPVAVAVVLVAMRPSLLPGDPFGDRTEAAALPPETAAPTTAPAAAPGTASLDHPFAGSPAERYADGADGIVVPGAKPVGAMGEEQVAQALKQTKALLVGANLDRKVLLGGHPKAALDVLDPKQPEMLDDVRSWLRHPDEDHDPLLLFSRFDPDEVRLVGDVVKTRGRMTFEAGEDGASVVVHADYTFVYALAPADEERTEVTRTIVRRALDVRLLDPAKYTATPGKLAVMRYAQDFGNSACDTHDGFLHPQFDSQAAAGPSAVPTGPTRDPYDRSRDIRDGAGAGECGVVSRT